MTKDAHTDASADGDSDRSTSNSREPHVAAVDTARNYGNLIPGRESHTADLAEFDKYVKQLQTIHREVDEPFEPKLWSFIRSVLEKGVSVGFEELLSSDEVAPKGKQDNDRMIEKIMDLGVVNPLYPELVASAAGISLHATLTELLYAAKKTALLSLTFAPECSRCGAAVCVKDRLGGLPTDDNCAACGFHNHIDCLDKIKIIFVLNQDVLYAPADNLICPPVKASWDNTLLFVPIPCAFTGSGVSYTTGFDRGEKLMVYPVIPPGRYRMRCPISSTDGWLEVEGDPAPDDEPIILTIKVSDMLVRNVDRENWKTITVPHGKLQFDAFADTHSLSILWIQKDQDEEIMLRLPDEDRTKYTTAAEALHHPVFQLLFREQVVNDGGSLTPHGAALTLSRVVLVFTDVVSSTKLYSSVGDAAALQMVRTHYEILFDAFTKRGRVVKTIGDSVMAAFTSGREALKAVAEALRRMESKSISHPGHSSALQIRVGMHAGPCIVVPLNGMNDYFGQTVNIAARLEGAARAGECLFSETMLHDDPETQSAWDELLDQGHVVTTDGNGLTLELKGVEGLVHAIGFRASRR